MLSWFDGCGGFTGRLMLFVASRARRRAASVGGDATGGCTTRGSGMGCGCAAAGGGGSICGGFKVQPVIVGGKGRGRAATGVMPGIGRATTGDFVSAATACARSGFRSASLFLNACGSANASNASRNAPTTRCALCGRPELMLWAI